MAAAERPNVLFILCDNLGYGDIGPFGARHHRTPNLDRLAAEGRRFTHYYAVAGVCTPSRAALMTGMYPCRVGLEWTERDGLVLRPLSPHGLAPETFSLGDLFKNAGYRTAYLGKWHLGDQPRYSPTRHGFDLYVGIPYSDDMTQETGRRLGKRYDGFRWPPLPWIYNDHIVEAPARLALATERLTRAAIEFIEANRQRPFFVFFSHVLPGSRSRPLVNPRFAGRSANGPWGDAVEEIDWSLGELLRALDRLDLARETIVIFTSDNGAPLTGRPGDLSRGSNGPLEGRGYTTAEGGFRVPMIVRWPGRVPPGSVCDELCTMMDWLPTFAALLGQPLPKGLRPDGYDVRGLLFDEPGAKTPYEALFYFHGRQLQAIRVGRYKLYLPLETFDRHPHFRPGERARPLLFDVVVDPACEHDLSRQQPELVEELMQWVRRAPCPTAGQR